MSSMDRNNFEVYGFKNPACRIEGKEKELDCLLPTVENIQKILKIKYKYRKGNTGGASEAVTWIEKLQGSRF